MADAPPIRSVIGLPPEDTVRAFEVRDTLRSTVRWSEMFHEDHARAFTVAKVAKLDLLTTIRGSLDDVIRGGGTFEQWQANIVPELQKAGWYGRVTDSEITGTAEPVFVGSRRLRTIYDTNLRVSRAAGRWSRIQELKDVRPFLRYTAVLDARTRPQHRALHGTILPVDHPWWDTHFPPCGWFCRCTVRQLSQRELDSHDWSVTKVPPAGPPQMFLPAGRTTPVEVPAGISPGFGYNPGKASMAAVADKARRSLENTAAEDLSAARLVIESLVSSDALPVFLKQDGGRFPVAILDREGVEMLRAPSPVIVLPNGVLNKQRVRHGEITIADYRNLPSVLHDPLVIIDQGDAKVIFYRSATDGKLYRAVARTDLGQPNTAIVSFHLARPRDVSAEARKGRIVLDRRSS